MTNYQSEESIFVENIDIIISNINKILNCRDYFFSPLPFAYIGTSLLVPYKLYLGYLCKAWELGIMIQKCPECKTKTAYVYAMGGLFFSQKYGLSVCSTCKKVIRFVNGGFKGQCPYCGKRKTIHIEVLIETEKEPSDDPNFILRCDNHNGRLYVFLRGRGYNNLNNGLLRYYKFMGDLISLYPLYKYVEVEREGFEFSWSGLKKVMKKEVEKVVVNPIGLSISQVVDELKSGLERKCEPPIILYPEDYASYFQSLNLEDLRINWY